MDVKNVLLNVSKVNSKNTRTILIDINWHTKIIYEICSKLTVKTPEGRPFIPPKINKIPVVFWWFQREQKEVLLVSLLLTLNTLNTIFSTLIKRCLSLLTLSTFRKTFFALISTVFINNFENTLLCWNNTQQTLAFSKLTIKTLKKACNVFKGNDKDTRTTSLMLFWCLYC